MVNAQTEYYLSDLLNNPSSYNLDDADSDFISGISTYELNDFIEQVTTNLLVGTSSTLWIDCYNGTEVQGYSTQVENGFSTCTYLAEPICLGSAENENYEIQLSPNVMLWNGSEETYYLSELLENWSDYGLSNPNTAFPLSISATELSEFIVQIAEVLLSEKNNTLVIDCYNGDLDILGATGPCTYAINQIHLANLSHLTISIQEGVKLEADFESFNPVDAIPLYEGEIITNAYIDNPHAGSVPDRGGEKSWEMYCAVCDTISMPCAPSINGAYLECYNSLTGNFIKKMHYDKNEPFCDGADFTPEDYDGLYSYYYVQKLVGGWNSDFIGLFVNRAMKVIDNDDDYPYTDLVDFYNDLYNFYYNLGDDDFKNYYTYARAELLFTYLFQQTNINPQTPGAVLVDTSPVLIDFYSKLGSCGRQMIQIDECNNINITGESDYLFNGTINTSADTRPVLDMKNDFGDYSTSNACEGRNIVRISGSSNINISNLRLENGFSDNLFIIQKYLYGDLDDDGINDNIPVENINIENVMMLNAGRNIVGILSFENLNFNNCQFIGAKNWNGIGIDIEPVNRNTLCKDFSVTNCYFKDNESKHIGIHFTGTDPDMFGGESTYTIENNLFDGGANHAISVDGFGYDKDSFVFLDTVKNKLDSKDTLTVYDPVDLLTNYCNLNIKKCGFVLGDYPISFANTSVATKITNQGKEIPNTCDVVFPYNVVMDDIVIYENRCSESYLRNSIGINGNKNDDYGYDEYMGNIEMNNIYIVVDERLKKSPLMSFSAANTFIECNGGVDENGDYLEGQITIFDGDCNDSSSCLEDPDIINCCVDGSNQYHLPWYNVRYIDSDGEVNNSRVVNFDSNYLGSHTWFNHNPADGCYITQNGGPKTYSNSFNIGLYKDVDTDVNIDKYELFKTKLSEASDIDFIPENLTGPSPGSFELEITNYCNGFMAECNIQPFFNYSVAWEVTLNGEEVAPEFIYADGYNTIILNNVESGQYQVTATISDPKDLDKCVNVNEIATCNYVLSESFNIGANNVSVDLGYSDPELVVYTNNLPTNQIANIYWLYEDGFVSGSSNTAVFDTIQTGGTTLFNPQLGNYYTIIESTNGCTYISNIVHLTNCEMSNGNVNATISSTISSDYLTVASDEVTTWNPLEFGLFDITVDGTVEVFGHLTIEGLQVHFTDPSKINVHPGGRLTVRNSATLTSYCGGQWQGIRVSYKLQGPIPHPIVEIYNDVTIEKALIGIATKRFNNNDLITRVPRIRIGASLDASFTNIHDYQDENGNSTASNLFRDNSTDIHIYRDNSGPSNWNNDNMGMCFVRNTRFERGNYNYGIRIDNIEDFTINDCQFVGNPDSLGFNKGCGVFMELARVDILNTSFIDLNNGVYVYNSRNSSFQSNTFHSNQKGIYSEFTENLRIRDNNFSNIEMIEPTLAGNDVFHGSNRLNANYGVHLFQSVGSAVINNAFQGLAAPSFIDYDQPGTHLTIGLVTSSQNLGLTNRGNLIHDNIFEGTNIGYFSQDGDRGVEVECNTFAADGQPHALTAWMVQDGPYSLGNNCAPIANNGAIYFNTWMDNSPPFPANANVSTLYAPQNIWFEQGLLNGAGFPVEYIVYANSTGSELSHPASVLEADDVNNCGLFQFEDVTCDTAAVTPTVNECLAIELELSTVTNAIGELQDLINGVDCFCGPEGGRLAAPCCVDFSDETATVNTPSGFGGFGGGAVGNFGSNFTRTGNCTVAECQELYQWRDELQVLENQADQLMAELAICICVTTTPVSCRINSLETYGRSTKQEVELAYLYLKDGDNQLALQTINNLYDNVSTDEQKVICNDRTIIQILSKKMDEGWGWTNMPQNVNDAVDELANCADLINSVKAKSILAFAENKVYIHPVTINSGNTASKTEESKATTDLDESTEFSVYPNPANDIVFIANSSKEDGKLTIFDVVGKEIKSQTIAANTKESIELSAWAKGIYVYEIRSLEGVVLDNGKLVVQ